MWVIQQQCFQLRLFPDSREISGVLTPAPWVNSIPELAGLAMRYRIPIHQGALLIVEWMGFRYSCVRIVEVSLDSNRNRVSSRTELFSNYPVLYVCLCVCVCVWGWGMGGFKKVSN